MTCVCCRRPLSRASVERCKRLVSGFLTHDQVIDVEIQLCDMGADAMPDDSRAGTDWVACAQCLTTAMAGAV